VPRKYALFFHRLSILERATDHGCINNCNHPKTHEFPALPPLPPPAGFTSSHLLSLAPPPPPSSVVVERDISGSGAPTGVFSQKKGDLSIVTGVAGIFDGSEPWENSVGA
jgi:hypothetical protein